MVLGTQRLHWLAAHTPPNSRYHVVLTPFSDSNAEVSASLVKGSVSTSGFTVITHKNGSLANISFDFTIIAQ